MLFYRQNVAEKTAEATGEATAVKEKGKGAQSAELWECALNYKIMRHLKENSEEEAWARLFSCNLFATNRVSGVFWGSGVACASGAVENARSRAQT